MSAQTDYTGRFAPSPSGPLHMGSLLSALASFLDARASGGRWLLRIEDIDPPREMRQAQQLIRDCLLAHGLHWDGDILRQSDRNAAYEQALQRLLDASDAYFCTCSRQQMHRSQGHHATECPRTEREPPGGAAARLKWDAAPAHFHDLLLGHTEIKPDMGAADPVLRRRDGIFAYQLGVVVDDAFQGITHVIRGRDLLDSTPIQLYLQDRLAIPGVSYGHLPLLLGTNGNKLSKQSMAPRVDDSRATTNLLYCLRILGQEPPPERLQQHVKTILDWATAHWQLLRIQPQDRICVSE